MNAEECSKITITNEVQQLLTGVRTMDDHIRVTLFLRHILMVLLHT